MNKKLPWLGLILVAGFIPPVIASTDSIDDNGISAQRLHQAPYNLTGKKIAIGQVEIGRPGQFGLDKQWIPAVTLAGLLHEDGPAKNDDFVDEHAMMVATVMVSKNKFAPGVAPDARLYSSAVGEFNGTAQPEECLASQSIAMQNSGDVRAINFSFGESLRQANAVLDGNALLTQCVDWSARVHDVLYVIAGNQGEGGIPIPTDNYNGINTAYTRRSKGRTGIFNKLDFANLNATPTGIARQLISRELNTNARRSIGLVAPGSQIKLYDINRNLTPVSGTSFAAPHVTASVALLQELVDRNIRTKQPHWSLEGRHHEVSKVVLLNSADKLQDTGDGLRLGMTRTVYTKNSQTWLDSDAYKDDKIPLDLQMGTGQLNAFRAYDQMNAGQWKPTAPVPTMGWDYNTVNINQYQDYVINQPLKKDSYASITLSWDRLVELQDSNNNKQFDIGESFTNKGLNNLDIYLIPANSNSTQKYTCASISTVDSTEHIFCPIPETGNYKIRVEYKQQINTASQAYGLAWWTVGD